MITKKPILIILALVYFGILSLPALFAVIYLLAFGGNFRIFAIIPFVILLPNVIGLILLLLKPKNGIKHTVRQLGVFLVLVLL